MFREHSGFSTQIAASLGGIEVRLQGGGTDSTIKVLERLQADLHQRIDTEMAHNLKPWKNHRQPSSPP
jgi:hypothetical protein